MKIAFITSDYPRLDGGAYRYAVFLVRELAKLGHKVTVFTSELYDTHFEQRETKNLKVVEVKISKRLPYPALQFWLLLPKAIRKAEKANLFDILHFNGYSYWFLKKKISSAPHIVTVHHLVRDAIKNTNQNIMYRLLNVSTETNIVYPFLERRVISLNSQKIICVSDFTKKRITETYNIPFDDIETIYNGIEVDGYIRTKQELEEIKNVLQVPGTPVILYVGRVDDTRKGLDLLLVAFKKLAESIDATLLIVGPGNNTRAKKTAQSLGILKNTVFAGSVDEITLKKCYALCDLYVFPSRLEGFGLPLLEASAAGKPIIATNVGAIPELVKMGINATLIHPDDVSALSDSMLKFFQHRESHEHLKARAIESLEKFSWKTTAEKTSRLYEQLIERNVE